MNNKVVLIVIDGFGLSAKKKGNAVFLAKPNFYNSAVKKNLFSSLKISGNHVGLPAKTQGTSEVGHLHLGSGRIVWQPFELINREIKSNFFFKNKALLKAVSNSKKKNRSLHLIGLCSDQGVHAHINHLHALLKMAVKNNVKNVFIHFISDGRDVPEKTAVKFIKKINFWTKKLGVGKIASVSGRFYSMDRDNNWDRTKESFEMLTQGKGFKETNPIKAIENSYLRNTPNDQFIEPTIITDVKGSPLCLIKNNDSVIFFNFRTDRARQLTKAFTDSKFKEFSSKKIKPLFVAFTNYYKNMNSLVAFEHLEVKNNLGEVLSKNNLKQLRIAETEKYAHVTYFFNSQNEKPFKNESRILIPSPKIKSHDLKPETSSFEIAEKAVKEIKLNKFDFILINFASPDLAAHTANLNATIKAVKAVDFCLKKISAACTENYVLLITGDHGNAEEMILKNGKANPAHTLNKVPFLLISNNLLPKNARLKNGEAIDVAPTILKLMNLSKPKEMTGKSLVVF